MKLGIVAGSGDLPHALIARCQAQHIDFHVLSLIGGYADFPHDYIRPGGGGTIQSLLRHRGITDLVIIGGINRPRFWDFWPDLFTLRQLPRLLKSWKGDDSLLSAVIGIVEQYGRVKVRGIHEFLPELLADIGVMGAHMPSAETQQAIDIGIKAARKLGEADIGQAVIADAKGVLAREDRSGTAALLKNFSSLSGSAVLIKLCKPQQELRVDLPTIGRRTIEAAKQAGLKGIAVSAGKTLIVDKTATIAAANDAELFLIGIES